MDSILIYVCMFVYIKQMSEKRIISLSPHIYMYNHKYVGCLGLMKTYTLKEYKNVTFLHSVLFKTRVLDVYIKVTF